MNEDVQTSLMGCIRQIADNVVAIRPQDLQSQTKIVGTLWPNPVFSLLVLIFLVTCLKF